MARPGLSDSKAPALGLLAQPFLLLSAKRGLALYLLDSAARFPQA